MIAPNATDSNRTAFHLSFATQCSNASLCVLIVLCIRRAFACSKSCDWQINWICQAYKRLCWWMYNIIVHVCVHTFCCSFLPAAPSTSTIHNLSEHFPTNTLINAHWIHTFGGMCRPVPARTLTELSNKCFCNIHCKYKLASDSDVYRHLHVCRAKTARQQMCSWRKTRDAFLMVFSVYVYNIVCAVVLNEFHVGHGCRCS